jgi:hypothetical protein
MLEYKLTNKIQFGKYKGDTIAEILAKVPQYIEWCLDEVKGFSLDDKAYEVYEEAIDKHYS